MAEQKLPDKAQETEMKREKVRVVPIKYTFRILTNLFAFYFFFLPTDDGCDFFIYVFDKKSFFSYTAGKRGLPVYCYGLRENMCVRIDFGLQDDYIKIS